MRRRLRLGSDSGQTLVEIALALPLLLLIVFGIMDFSRGLSYYSQLTQLAAEGARAAVVNRNPDGTAASGTSIQSQVAAQATNEIESSDSFEVCIDHVATLGQPVTVTARFDFQFIPFLGFADWTLEASSTMRSESTTPTYSAGCEPA